MTAPTNPGLKVRLIQTNKINPGPAMDWDRGIEGARALLDPPAPRPRRYPTGKGWG